jgi:hypothetical protein
MTMTARPQVMQTPGNVTVPAVLWFTATAAQPAKMSK